MSKFRALISVYDKTGIVELAEKLTAYNYEIISTGGTYNLLKNNNVDAIEVKDITNMDEMLEGRVKTLHPNIFAGILARTDNPNDMQELQKNNIETIDLVIVNLYPFAQKKTTDFIDIGGVSLIRAAAKNYQSVSIVTSPNQYEKFLENLDKNNGQTDEGFRKELAHKAFQLTAKYDNIIADSFNTDKELSEDIRIDFDKIQELRYGENPYQTAGLYSTGSEAKFELLNGKELSFNNIFDMSAAYNIVSEFLGINACAIIKHNNPCGVALGETIAEAYTRALECDPISAFGGIVAFNNEVDGKTAKMMKELFLEVIIAPDYTPKALEVLRTKKNLRVIKLNTSLEEYKNHQSEEIRITPFGTLVQVADKGELEKDNFKVVTKAKPTAEMVEDMIFAWKIAKHAKSNAIVIAKDFKAIGIGQGQTSRVDAFEIALNKACDGSKDAVAASDGFFPAIDNIHVAAQGRIAAIIQPGGSIKDEEVIKTADKYNIAMITTGMRHFKH